MRFWHLNNSRARVCPRVFSLLVILAAFLFLQQPCEAQQPLAPRPDTGFGTIVGWIYCGLAACFLAAVIVAVFRRKKMQRQRSRAPIWARASKNKSRVNSISSNSSSVRNGKPGGNARPKLVSNHSHGSKPFHHNRRKRVFDYSKFYAKVMRELSRHSYEPPAKTNAKSHSNGHANGHSNGHAAANNMNTNQSTKSEIEDLVAAQKSMIQEQKRLLDEQTRLIEEKRCFIEEQIAFLKTRAELPAEPQSNRLKFQQG
jgi:hypothetical protein